MALQLELAYLYPKDNADIHKTHYYEMVHLEEPVAVLRRGRTFSMALRFSNRAYNRETDVIQIVFSYGPNPNVRIGTIGIVNLTSTMRKNIEEDGDDWIGNILSVNGDTVTVEVFSPTTIPVGLWKMNISTSLINSTLAPSLYEHKDGLYFLFNPWNCHDLVYMPEEDLLDEYILNDVGKIWVGPVNGCRGREWVFGQFDACVLPAINFMFEKSGLAPERFGDPILLSRMISKMVNVNDDEGVICGRWDGDYEDGTAPNAWTGSVPILQEYLEKEAPVMYGQCWVFAGVVTTICRAIGIPSRVVSNLVSAHDTNATLTIDRYYDKNNEEMDDPYNVSKDSIWNYHVWNDVYMARPDLPPGYGGWQAIDATPQEASHGFYQCGPASLEAIKKGQIGLNYDVGFMISSVNADYMLWKEDPSSKDNFSKILSNKYHIGRFILTKKPFLYDFNGDRDRLDITNLYKAKEGTTAERLALLNAVRGATPMAKTFYSLPDPSKEDVVFKLKDIDSIRIGENFRIVVDIKNKSNQVRHIQCIVSASSVYYNGNKGSLIIKKGEEVVVPPQLDKRLNLVIRASDYLEKLVEYSNMKIKAIATVSETKQTWYGEDDFQVINPNINIDIQPEISLGQPTTISLKFVNPLAITITNCKFNISGSGLLKNQVIQYQDVGPKEYIKVDATIIPKTVGEQKIIATFTSKQLRDITGSVKTEVE